MAIDQPPSTRSSRTAWSIVGIVAVIALVIVLAGVFTGPGDNGSVMNARTPAAGDTAAATDITAAPATDATTDAGANAVAPSTVTVGDTAVNDTTMNGDADGLPDTETATAMASCDFDHLIGSTASETANVIRQSNMLFYMVTPDVNPASISDEVRREQVRVDVDSAGRVTDITCPGRT